MCTAPDLEGKKGRPWGLPKEVRNQGNKPENSQGAIKKTIGAKYLPTQRKGLLTWFLLVARIGCDRQWVLTAVTWLNKGWGGRNQEVPTGYVQQLFLPFYKSGCRKKLGNVPCKTHQPVGSYCSLSRPMYLQWRIITWPCETRTGANVWDVLMPSVLKGWGSWTVPKALGLRLQWLKNGDCLMWWT